MMHTGSKQPLDDARAVDLLTRAAALNRSDPLRRGSLLEFPDFGQLVMTGDMHGHRRNFDKLVRFADLNRAGARHIILHELIHEDVAPGQPDLSYELMLAAAAYKCEFPEQVHFLQSNHELAQLTGQLISKGGRDVVQEFNRSVGLAFGHRGGERVLDAIRSFIASFPIAGRTPNRVWLSHSLPDEEDMPGFDRNVARRGAFGSLDQLDGGSVYSLVWGRRHSPEILTALANAWDVDWFIMGHQPQESGYGVMFDRVIILASDHSHGVFLPFDLSKPQTLESLVKSIRKFAAVP